MMGHCFHHIREPMCDSDGHELDEKYLALLPHLSPIGWDNIILYGGYVLDRSLIK
ncbi:hypothetical protein [Candidatus Odyssella acanthamoebae]|uniref:hypothetical protein n=1 Tax=Candidatus Odyssella acanthamoebae TaxID=91604 RepID=UPI0012EBB82A|nr:hypothetical protein [Candidatus Paracaedibacter acanthamoebae]